MDYNIIMNISTSEGGVDKQTQNDTTSIIFIIDWWMWKKIIIDGSFVIDKHHDSENTQVRFCFTNGAQLMVL